MPGGARPGAGRPTTDTVRLRFMVLNITRVKLERIAKKLGKPGMLGEALNHVMEGVETEEPEYLKLAREIKEAGMVPRQG